jgi:hypothetical protein
VHTPIIPARGMLRQKGFKFEASLHSETLSQKKKKNRYGRQIGESHFESNPDKNLVRSPSQQTNQALVVHICNPSCSGGRDRRIAAHS